jgi:hypothetical protein
VVFEQPGKRQRRELATLVGVHDFGWSEHDRQLRAVHLPL